MLVCLLSFTFLYVFITCIAAFVRNKLMMMMMMMIAAGTPKTQRCLKDRKLNQAKSKPDTVDRPVRTARNFVQHYNSTQYCK